MGSQRECGGAVALCGGVNVVQPNVGLKRTGVNIDPLREYVTKAFGWAINEKLQPVYGYVAAVYLTDVALGSLQNSIIDQIYLTKQVGCLWDLVARGRWLHSVSNIYRGLLIVMLEGFLGSSSHHIGSRP